MFLIWFVISAVVIASVLIFIEVRLKRKKIRAATKRREKTPIDRMKITLSRNGDVRKKLDVVGSVAKSYFKKEYGMPLRSDYSELAREFEKRRKSAEVEFCEGMFEAYYSDKELTVKKVEGLADLLGEIYRRKSVSKKISNVPGFGDKVFRVLKSWEDSVLDKIRKYTSNRREKSERRARVANRKDHELLNWVRRAIEKGYDKIRVSDLLKDGKRSAREIKKILKVYDKEVTRVTKKSVSGFHRVGAGIAQKIIREEKNRLEGAEVLGVEVQ